jgi:FAD/FMN-containing dehydrogenase
MDICRVRFSTPGGVRRPRRAWNLAAVKAAYDPDNMFHRNQNIRPSR